MTLHQFTAFALVGSGFTRLTRTLQGAQACVLTFHGIAESSGGPERAINHQQDPTPAVFRTVCRHLSARYKVVPARKVVSALKTGEPLPPNAVAITFDDGFASNYHLAFPILREFGLPATIFACTGFMDGIDPLWFNRLELAFARTTVPWARLEIGGHTLRLPLATVSDRAAALAEVLPAIKRLPQSEVAPALAHIDNLLQTTPVPARELPASLQAMSWDQAREMHRSGLVEFGAHTHHHPILARCTPEVAREEICTSRDRITTEIGQVPKLFAYPNGNAGDFDDQTIALLSEAGFEAAFTMTPGFARQSQNIFALPRYGSPGTTWETEATASGAFETFKAWRARVRRAFAPTHP